ncbi:hypothetical protein O4J56_26695 [Nocardiopsis sp. RSe5-2]|uniref:Protein-L-isoaspartate O-methyltransferase n=1 Tax=Nocardiopsis endophytica TaxID=3018445 RepID=A0ABT4UBZ4_9ACTN|nr:methyltransferase domain-containing protein [Nocardiopsis endophytica]MDA2814266.1 hypothetical protein [Nocardiopsis endophytica]
MTPPPGAAIARVLTAKGAVQDPAWHHALLAVDRDAFVPETVWADCEGDGTYRPYPRTDPDVQRWMRQDVSLVTQVDDGSVMDAGGRPSSSLSQPSLVVRMLQELDAADGQTVLEIGTGSGYNTALLCERLGDANVTSVEVDPGVAWQAARALEALGYKPTLIIGDGAAGAPGATPFDHLISTVAVREIPSAWIEQTRPGGRIVTPWAPGPGFASSSLLRMVVGANGEAHGRLVGDAAFMVLRDHRPAAVSARSLVDEDDPAARTGSTRTNPRWVADRHPGWQVVLGHLVPGLGYASYEAAEDHASAAGEATVYVVDRDGSGSWALGEYEPGPGPYETRTRGPRDLWAEVAAARTVWERAGRPGRDRLGLTVHPDGRQEVWLDTPDQVLAV